MEIRRFFIDSNNTDGSTLTLSGREARHAVQVLRQKVGYRIIASTGDGFDLNATITEVGRDYVKAVVESKTLNYSETKGDFTLFQCIGKEADFIVQKSVEMGFRRFVPVISDYSLVKTTVERWKTIALDAAKQCGRARVLEVCEPLSYKDAIATFSNYDKVIFPYENAQIGAVSNVNFCNASKIALLIGSEGGFSPKEAVAAEGAGAVSVTLGKRILRSETAAVAAMTLVLEYSGELR